MAYKLTWLADVLRAAGCTVVEEDGWKDRGRGEMGTVKGVMQHHTGPGSEKGLLALIRDGRSDLAGPLSQLFLPKSGVFHVIAAGRTNHAGNGSWHGITSGNAQTIGIEAQNAGDGKDPWPAVQMEALVKGTAAILEHIKADPLMTMGHREYATPRGRKIDPTFDMNDFRELVDVEMDSTDTTSTPVVSPLPIAAHRLMLRKGDRGESVKEMQRGIGGLTVDGLFGPATDRAVRAWQKANGLVTDGLFGPKSWAKLLEGKG